MGQVYLSNIIDKYHCYWGDKDVGYDAVDFGLRKLAEYYTLPQPITLDLSERQCGHCLVTSVADGADTIKVDDTRLEDFKSATGLARGGFAQRHPEPDNKEDLWKDYAKGAVHYDELSVAVVPICLKNRGGGNAELELDTGRGLRNIGDKDVGYDAVDFRPRKIAEYYTLPQAITLDLSERRGGHCLVTSVAYGSDTINVDDTRLEDFKNATLLASLQCRLDWFGKS
ncbi:hypothetical protein BDK51DRAFT_41660 [Blyttiomyces helicus]|uniref:Uncharacterized protein n=1 Tax=Blyttiomyces helicus TaxID=388810 RepID=A0A4P9WML0_9FUNG|nr:hypothetical protein BDK51DRAFT_41660 [Blyttiomyces helicus]|eukprot:RKO93722.1 hypothetical protein BDK51DRAFT_41660 [Blyttiomyces helicus]